MLKQHSQFFKGLMLINDLLFVSLAWWLAYLIRFHTLLFPSPDPYLLRHYIIAYFFILIIWGSVFRFLDLHRPRRISGHLQEAVDIVKGALLALLIFLGVIFLFRDIILSRTVVVIFWILSVVLVNLSHIAFREILRFFRRRGYNLRHILVIGSSVQVRKLVRQLLPHTHLGLRIVGVCVIDESNPGPEFQGVLVLKSLEEALNKVRLCAADQVFITLPLEEAGKLREIRDLFGAEAVTMHFVPDLVDIAPLRGRVEEFDGIPIISIQSSPLYGWNSFLKRLVDFSVALVVVSIFAPLMIFIALLIRLTSTESIFYRQERMGLDGRRFQILKFRTMKTDAEESSGPVWASENDPRVTSIGRWLRRTDLDELPQLFNVLKGDMSLVGPRPERPFFVEEFRKIIPKYMLRHKVKAGITGWAQVHGWRGNTSLEKRIEHDIYYIENWSLRLDMKILALSLFRGFLNKNAY